MTIAPLAASSPARGRSCFSAATSPAAHLSPVAAAAAVALRGARMSSPNLQAYRGPNHVLVTRRATRAALRARTRKLLASRRWPAVHLHGLGAAIAPTIVLAGELVEASNGQLLASCSTSTEVLVDHATETDLNSSSTLRHNSAVHISLAPAPATNAAARATSRGKRKLPGSIQSAAASEKAAGKKLLLEKRARV